jgi:hypothetical protein
MSWLYSWVSLLTLAMAVMRRFPRLWLISRDAYIRGRQFHKEILFNPVTKKNPSNYQVKLPGKHVSESRAIWTGRGADILRRKLGWRQTRFPLYGVEYLSETIGEARF